MFGELKGQFTLRSCIIGVLGCVIITATSVYTALKLGALPWPIIFAALISLVFLKALAHIGGRATNLNEANVTHTVMSAGAMVAGGLAFTIPGIWILDPSNTVAWWEMLIVALAGCITGLICTAILRRHFIERSRLEYPIGQAAAQTLIAGNSGGKMGIKLFTSMGLAGIYTVLRNGLGVIPTMLLNNITIPGVAFGIYNSPMLLAVGFLVGTASVVAWFIGALLGNFGIIVGGTAASFWDVTTAQGITSSLGMGVMMGCGVGVIAKIIASYLRKGKKQNQGDPAEKSAPAPRPSVTRLSAGLIAAAVAAVFLLICFALQLGPLPSAIVVVLAWVTAAMAAQSVGQTGIDPMEIFGLIVLLLVAAASSLPQVQLFFVAGVIAVACGLAGDVMNDFKAGHIIGTDPRAQWLGEAIGGIVGALVAVAVLAVLVGAYGPTAFGPQGSFIAAQASVVATMVSGIPSLPAFILGFVAGSILYLTGLPVMMLGLGIYLPFYMSFTAFLGAMAKVAYDAVCKWRRRRGGGGAEDDAVLLRKQQENGLVVSSGALGGESLVEVGIALITVVVGISAAG
jgi:uncharacterized oligopeptide transporter (OPT) family protein